MPVKNIVDIINNIKFLVRPGKETPPIDEIQKIAQVLEKEAEEQLKEINHIHEQMREIQKVASDMYEQTIKPLEAKYRELDERRRELVKQIIGQHESSLKTLEVGERAVYKMSDAFQNVMTALIVYLKKREQLPTSEEIIEKIKKFLQQNYPRAYKRLEDWLKEYIEMYKEQHSSIEAVVEVMFPGQEKIPGGMLKLSLEDENVFTRVWNKIKEWFGRLKQWGQNLLKKIFDIEQEIDDMVAQAQEIQGQL